MEFLRLKGKNYKSYGPDGFELPLNELGIHQLAGTNGVGKTNLVEAFLWVLTDKQLKSGAKVGEVVNWHAGRGQWTEVQLEFRSDDGRLYRAERYRNHPVYKHTLRLLCEGVEIDEPGVKADPQAELQRLVGLKYDELVGSLVFSAEDFKSFIEQKPEQKREFAATFFRIDRFQAPAKCARDERLETKRRIDAATVELEKAEGRLAAEREHHVQAQKGADHWEFERRSNLEALRRELTEINALNAVGVLVQHDQRDAAQRDVETAKRDVTRLEGELAEARRQEAEAQAALIQGQIDIEVAQHDQRDAAQREVETAKRDVTRLEGELAEARRQEAEAQAALTEQQIGDEIEKHDQRDRLQARIDAVGREVAGAEAGVTLAQANVQAVVGRQQSASANLKMTQDNLVEGQRLERSTAIPRLQRAIEGVSAAQQRLDAAGKPDCPTCGQPLPAHLVTPEEIERRLNSARSELDRALNEAQAAKADYERLVAQRQQLLEAEQHYLRAAAQLEEERSERVVDLAGAHQRVADLHQALTGNPDNDPPLVGLLDQLAELPVPAYSREELQQHRVLSAGRVTLERQRQARENSLRQASFDLEDAQQKHTALPVPPHSREELARHQSLASARAALEAQVRAKESALGTAQTAEAGAAHRLRLLPIPALSRSEAQGKLVRAAWLNSSIEAAEKAINPFLDSVRTSEARVSGFSTEVTEVSGRLQKDRELHPVLDALVRAFDRDLPQAVLRQLLPRFNSYLQGYLDELLPTCKLTFNEALQDYLVYEGKEVAARQLSTGQRARVNFAVCMATFSTMLWERGRITNVAFFDEVLDFGLDDAGQQEAFEQLKGLAMSVFIITHKATLTEEFDSRYVAQRVSPGFTQLVRVV